MTIAPRRATAAVAATALALALLTGALGAGAVPAASSAPGRSLGVASALLFAGVPRPAAGFGLGSNGISPAAISLNWTESTAAEFVNYTVLYSNVSATGPWRYYTTITAEASDALGVDNLVPGATYFWNVTAYSTGLLGLGSTTATYSNVYAAAQPTLAYLTSPANTSTTVNLTWTNNATYGGGIAFSSYAVVEDVDNATGLYSNVTNPSTRAITVIGLPSGSSHSFGHASASGYLVRCQVTDHSGTRFVTAPVTVVVDRDPRVSASVSPVNTTTGASVSFHCTGSDGTAPLTVGWTLGDGATLSGTGDVANGSASYGSAGTYVAHCTVSDTAGGRATASIVVHVAASAAFAWVTPTVVLGVAALAGLAVALAVLVYRRREERAERSSAMARWLPPTGPAATVVGAKICPKCGASNVPLRRTCQACGTPLPRNPSP